MSQNDPSNEPRPAELSNGGYRVMEDGGAAPAAWVAVTATNLPDEMQEWWALEPDYVPPESGGTHTLEFEPLPGSVPPYPITLEAFVAWAYSNGAQGPLTIHCHTVKIYPGTY